MTPTGNIGSTIAMMREGEADERLLVEGYTERMELGSLIPNSFSFMEAVMTKLPPAESPTNIIFSPVVPVVEDIHHNHLSLHMPLQKPMR